MYEISLVGMAVVVASFAVDLALSIKRMVD